MRELAPGVHVLGGRKGGRVRAFLLDTAGELTLVDTLFEDDARDVLAAIHALGRSPRDLKHIVLTHAHRSHLGGVAALKRETGATVRAHEWEADIVAGDRAAQSVGLKPTRPFRTYPFQVGIFLGRPRHRPCDVDEPAGEDEAVGPLRVLHTPGHSPGHLALWWEERGLLIAGDAIATWPRFEAGWPAFNLNREQAAASVARMAALEPRLVGVGHGEPLEDGAAGRIAALTPSR